MATEPTGIRLPISAHTEQPWRIHEIAPDFIVEDVWALPTPGGPDDFPLALQLCAESDPSNNPSLIARTMFDIRWKLGEVFGWDDEDKEIERVGSLRERLPQDLLDGPTGPETPNAPFRPVYATDNEYVNEIVNKTVHGLGHYSWVRTADGSYRGQMAVLTKPNGRLGELYMAGIKPLRYAVVYPPLMRRIAADWERVKAEASAS